MNNINLFNGDCLDVMGDMEDNSVDLILTDPPYFLTNGSGSGFMGKSWDSVNTSESIVNSVYEFHKAWAVEALRVAKPGAHLMAFGGTRTYHRLAVAIEDAGWEIRDTLAWVYGSGFPKSHNISKAIDKAAGAEREVIKTIKKKPSASSDCNEGWVRPWAEGKTTMDITAPSTPEAKKYSGFGTSLKPAFEPIVLARKPFKGTVASNVLEWGTGGLNIDACRVGTEGGTKKSGSPSYKPGVSLMGSLNGSLNGGGCESINKGRFPANFIHDGSDEVIALFPETKSGGSAGMRQRKAVNTWGGVPQNYPKETSLPPSEGSAARFFYCAKASKSERGEGNTHPTVKPLKLMEYLVTLASVDGSTVLDPFMGSGTTGIACAHLGRKFIGIEKDDEYFKIAQTRLLNQTFITSED